MLRLNPHSALLIILERLCYETIQVLTGTATKREKCERLFNIGKGRRLSLPALYKRTVK